MAVKVLAGPALTEVIYRARTRGNASSAEQIHAALTAQGLRVVQATEADLRRAAELLELPSQNPGNPSPAGNAPATLSLGDALILAVSERLGAQVLTSDKYWDWMVQEGLLSVKVHTL